VLLAEDNEANRRVFSQFLTGFGCRVDMVGNGADAVSAASTAPYDLILMDVQMPGLDGLEATRRIRGGSGPNRQSPIVALTGNAFAEDVTACHAAGMSDHVAKPLRRRTLEQALLRHIGHPSARRSATG
jgi:CheY-like chemotaxis protein